LSQCLWIGNNLKKPHATREVIATREVVVEPIAERESDVPLDIGTVEIKPPAPKP
jgi:hypothetical protein